MQIDKTRFKPLTKQENQHWRINNLCLYYGEPSYFTRECPKKHGSHVAGAISITNPQLEESENEHV
jgi:hypothetical protein